MRRPLIKKTPPGPRASEWISRDHRYTSPSLPREYPLVALKGSGMWIEDPDANVYLDFTSGIAVCNTGHCHPQVVAAVQEQVSQLIHTCGADFYHPPMIRLVERLAQITPGDCKKRVFLANSGAEVVESGLKLARWHTGRQKIIAFLGAFHGRTLGALSLNASKVIQTKGFGPLVPGIVHVPYGHCYRCAYNLVYPDCDYECVRYIEEVTFKSITSPDEVALIAIEPIQGEGGYIVPPPDYHRRLKEMAGRYGILYMMDEIQTGMGRTGKMFASEHFGVQPDIVTLAKGIASGMPLSAMIARSELMGWSRGAHGSTFGGNPVSCAAGLATLELLEAGLVDNAGQRGEQLMAGLRSLQEDYECLGDVRGLGLMQAVELVLDRESKEPAADLRNAILRRCFEQGLLLLSCGESTIRFCPPLIVTADLIDVALEIFRGVLKEVTGSGSA
jgi:4-aminobutyrate aminotransferase